MHNKKSQIPLNEFAYDIFQILRISSKFESKKSINIYESNEIYQCRIIIIREREREREREKYDQVVF